MNAKIMYRITMWTMLSSRSMYSVCSTGYIGLVVVGPGGAV